MVFTITSYLDSAYLLSILSMRYSFIWVNFETILSNVGEENGNPLQYSCLENSMDRRAWMLGKVCAYYYLFAHISLALVFEIIDYK